MLLFLLQNDYSGRHTCRPVSFGKLYYNDGFLFWKLRTLKIVRQILPRNDSEQGLKDIDNWLWIILY